MSSLLIPARSIACWAALKPMEAVPSVESFAINRRSSIPVRSTIQSWLVSMSVDKSSFVTLFSGKYLPRPVIFELYCFIMR